MANICFEQVTQSIFEASLFLSYFLRLLINQIQTKNNQKQNKMKTKKQMSKLVAGAAIALASVSPSFGQSNLGAGCGCPPVASRQTVTVSTLPGFVAVSGTTGGELTQGGNFTCDKTYILDQKIYVPSGQILVIQPGTIIKGKQAPLVAGVPDPAQATALVIERGGKIIASGSAECPIVFTNEFDPMDGTYSFAVATNQKWGGVVILGKATNNLSLAANGPFVAGSGNGKLAVADGLGTIEGFSSSNVQDRFGVNTSATSVPGELSSQSFDDNDNSGILKYVSIRHAGAILSVGSEINGLTLGSVGRGTTIERVEILDCADDNIEFFGGTVNVKYITTLFGNDDMFDYDLGWSGKAQFLFGMKGDNSTYGLDADNGFEADSDDNKSNNNPRSTPVMYNVTLIGNAKTTITSDNSSIAAINAKELAGGEIYNSVFANWKNGLNLIQALGTRTGASESYHNWSATNGNGSQILKVKCNTFVGVTNPLTIGSSVAAVTTNDNTQFTTTDLNVIVVGNTLPGFDYSFTGNPATNAITVKNDVVPNPALSVTGCPVAPSTGFFVNAPYRGAFASSGDNWLSTWTYSAFLGSTKGIQFCPTDINKDGTTDVNDFLIFAPAFGTNCN